MKTRIKVLVTLLSVAVLVLAAGNAFALTGSCVNCHTMHNSQDGTPMNFDLSDTANEMLLRAGTCGGCHADATAIDAGVPQVNRNETEGYLAGGSFKWVAEAAGDAKGHNVVDLDISPDATLTDPPGFDPTINADIGTDWANNQLTCAGVYGCHGNHTETDVFAALDGAHHGNVNGKLDAPTDVGSSYRFLLDVKGGESFDWEENPTADSHNVYFGNARTALTNPTDTISALCAQCHGKFHTAADIVSDSGSMSSPWVRHPSDIDMRAAKYDGTEYANYDYHVQAPAALSVLPDAVDANSYDNEAIVTCISCHRAHGSEHDDLLRWAYSGMVAGPDNTPGQATGEGCFRCHTAKDGEDIVVVP